MKIRKGEILAKSKKPLKAADKDKPGSDALRDENETSSVESADAIVKEASEVSLTSGEQDNVSDQDAPAVDVVAEPPIDAVSGEALVEDVSGDLAPELETQSDVLDGDEVSEGKVDNVTGDAPAWETQDADQISAHSPTVDVPEPQIQVIKGSAWPAFFGGLVAALIGFVIGRGDLVEDFLPASMQRETVDVSSIEAQIAALEAQNNLSQQQSFDLKAALEAAITSQDVRLDALESVDDVSILTSLSDLAADIEIVVGRLTDLEARPIAEAVAPGAPVEAVEELQAALDAQNAQINVLSERAVAAEAQAASEAALLLARAALTRVITAVDNGEAFDAALVDLEEVTSVEIPEDLRSIAETGVPTLATLQAGFPEAARAGLAAARSEVPESEVVGITGFLKRQLNVRSITPREGDDPDAVLSRVQAAVSNGDLAAALAEVGTLPDVSREAMNDWLEAAAARKAAQDAASALADGLNSN
ncbi:MAG: hypothetical protein ABJ360_08015 [Roseobacter sp.]